MNNEKESEGHVFGRGTIAVFVLEGEKGQRSKIEGSIKWRKSTASVRFTPTSSLHCAVLWASVTELVQAALVTCVRDELGSCGPGSSTAVALFYILYMGQLQTQLSHGVNRTTAALEIETVQ